MNHFLTPDFNDSSRLPTRPVSGRDVHFVDGGSPASLALLKRAGIRPARLTPLPASWIPRVLGVPDAWFERLGRRMLTIDPLARSSMSDDLATGRATEIDWINGEVVRLAQRLGQTAPVNERLCELVREAEQADVRPSWSGEALLAEMRAAAGDFS